MKICQGIQTEEVFIIDTIVYGNLTTYEIKDQDKGAFYEQELQLIVEPKMYHIQRVIRKKKEGGRLCIAMCKVERLLR